MRKFMRIEWTKMSVFRHSAICVALHTQHILNDKKNYLNLIWLFRLRWISQKTNKKIYLISNHVWIWINSRKSELTLSIALFTSLLIILILYTYIYFIQRKQDLGAKSDRSTNYGDQPKIEHHPWGLDPLHPLILDQERSQQLKHIQKNNQLQNTSIL